MIAFDHEVTRLAIQPIALRIKRTRTSERIGGRQQRPILAVARPLKSGLRRRVQIQNRASGAQPFAIDVAQHDAAAGREDDVDSLHQSRERLFFACAKNFLPLDLENGRNGHTESTLQLDISINESLAETAREHAAERGLATARHANEKEIAPTQMHGRNCSGGAYGNEEHSEVRRAATA